MNFKVWLETNNLVGPSGSRVTHFFKTAQGSKYILTEKNESRRVKSFHANTGGEDQGLHEWFQQCVFVPPTHEIQANSYQNLRNHYSGPVLLGASSGTLTFFIVKNNKWEVALFKDAFQKAIRSPLHAKKSEEPMQFPYTKTPTIGYSVAEWSNKSDNTIKSYHFGSPVSEVKLIQQVNSSDLQDFL
jgi:hypothetical protein